MPPTMNDMELKLNELYFYNPTKYIEYLEMIKGLGYKVLRNSSGKHKVQINNDYLKEAFGGIFGDLF